MFKTESVSRRSRKKFRSSYKNTNQNVHIFFAHFILRYVCLLKTILVTKSSFPSLWYRPLVEVPSLQFSFISHCETDAIYLFIVMLHATIRNLNCFTNNQILHILNFHLHLQLSLKASPRGYCCAKFI